MTQVERSLPSPAVGRRDFILLVVLCTLALVVRVGLALSRPTDLQSLQALPDQTEYLAEAKSVLAGKGFCFFDPAFHQTVYAYRLPGYPLFVAACGARVTIVRVVQCVVDISTAWAVYLIARRWLCGPPLMVAVAFVAFNPFLIYFSSLLLSETLFTAMLAWAMWMQCRGSGTWRLASMLILALSIYVRPSAIGLAVALAVAMPLTSTARGVWIAVRDRLGQGFLAAAITLLVLLPWAWRNHQTLGAWVWGTTNSGFTLYDGYNPRADGSSNQAFFRAWPQLQGIGEVERSAYLTGLAKDFALKHPLADARLVLAKVARLWSPVPLSTEYGGRSSYVVVGVLFTIPLFILSLVGLFSSNVCKNLRLYLLVPALYFTLVHGATVGSLRYRVPADVPLAVLAGFGVSAGGVDRLGLHRMGICGRKSAQV
ncbi:MAG: hypothetical protein ACTHLN_01380 [Tepidisphaeraceae bacterium]